MTMPESPQLGGIVELEPDDWNSCPVCLAHLRRSDGGKTSGMMSAYHAAHSGRQP